MLFIPGQAQDDLAQGVIAQAIGFFTQGECIAALGAAHPILVFLLMLAIRATHGRVHP